MDFGRVADRAVPVRGGLGYCRDLPVERLYRDAHIFRIFDGTSEIHLGVIGRYFQTIEHGTYGGELLDGTLLGYVRNAAAMIGGPLQFDFYSDGGLDIA